MATFDFEGGDVTATGGQYNGGSVTHTTTSFTEQGIDFTFTSNGTVPLPQTGFSAFTMLASGLTSAAPLVGTLNVVDTDSGEEFLSQAAVSLQSFGPSVPGNQLSVQVQFINTVNTALNTTVTLTTTTSGSGQVLAAPTPANEYNQIVFTVSGGYATVNHITGTPNCFAAGTMITTDRGDVAVEDLIAGDLVRAKDGRLTPVTWLGTQEIDTRLMHPAQVNPICITAGALGNGLPKRDLHLSPDHAVEIDGTLYNAGALVNSESIYQLRNMPREGFTYYHVETAAHELLLAEGVASESFIDYAGRDSFDNAAEAEAKVIPEMALPRVSSKRLVPAELRERIIQNVPQVARKAA